MSTATSTTPAALNSAQVDAQAAELMAALDEAHDSLRRLLALAKEKLAAIRTADTVELKRVAERECEELQRLFERERRRDATVARLAQTLHCDSEQRPRVSELADRMHEPFSSRLRAKTEGLRATAGLLQQRNRVAAGVARSLHQHIREVFEDVARVNRETIGYRPDGQYERQRTDSWVDAIG